ncbi:MAG: 50S ribosomal protein L16 [Kordiimonadales bacterium]|nr:MAG: 50S ribosomal protein L16 [Kordiimonadales bacterium]
MIRPKNVKYEKSRRSLYKNKTKRGYSLEWKSNQCSFGDYALCAVQGGMILGSQIVSSKQAILHKLKRKGQLWVIIFPSVSITGKPKEVRMGKGKGNVTDWGISVKPGQILYELTGVPYSIAKIAFKTGGAKLPIRTKMQSNLFLS